MLLLDGDSTPFADLAPLFDHPAYRQHGNMFWPGGCGAPPHALIACFRVGALGGGCGVAALQRWSGAPRQLRQQQSMAERTNELQGRETALLAHLW